MGKEIKGLYVLLACSRKMPLARMPLVLQQNLTSDQPLPTPGKRHRRGDFPLKAAKTRQAWERSPKQWLQCLQGEINGHHVVFIFITLPSIWKHIHSLSVVVPDGRSQHFSVLLPLPFSAKEQASYSYPWQLEDLLYFPWRPH